MLVRTPKLPSLGDVSTAGFVRIRHQIPLPEGRDNVVKEFARILSLGRVQRVVLEIGEPILYEQLQPGDPTVETVDLEKIEADDLFNEVRNTELIDFKQRGESGFFETLFLAFSFLSVRELVPKAILCSNWFLLRQMLGLDAGQEPVEQIFGVRTHTQPEVPEDVIVFVACDPTQPHLVALSLRIPLEIEDSPVRRRKT
jgi:hypothetical protein